MSSPLANWLMTFLANRCHQIREEYRFEITTGIGNLCLTTLPTGIYYDTAPRGNPKQGKSGRDLRDTLAPSELLPLLCWCQARKRRVSYPGTERAFEVLNTVRLRGSQPPGFCVFQPTAGRRSTSLVVIVIRVVGSFVDQSSAVASTAIVPGVRLDCTITCARPLNRLRRGSLSDS